MQVETILLLCVLLVEVAIGVTLFLAWRRKDSLSDRAAISMKGVVQEEVNRLERYLDGKVDLLLARLDDLSLRGTKADEAEPAAEEPAPVGDLQEYVPAAVRPRASGGRERSESEQLALLLDSPDFCSGVWPDMDGRFGEASARLLGYLAGQGVAEPEVEPYPPTGVEYENHWDFLVVKSRNAGGEGARFLIPRNYSRYDPARHDHLFRVMRDGGSSENFVKELRQSAVLRGSGALEGFISPKAVEKRGVLVVRE